MSRVENYCVCYGVQTLSPSSSSSSCNMRASSNKFFPSVLVPNTSECHTTNCVCTRTCGLFRIPVPDNRIVVCISVHVTLLRRDCHLPLYCRRHPPPPVMNESRGSFILLLLFLFVFIWCGNSILHRRRREGTYRIRVSFTSYIIIISYIPIALQHMYECLYAGTRAVFSRK